MSNFFEHSPAQSPATTNSSVTNPIHRQSSSSSLHMMGYRNQGTAGPTSATGATTPTHGPTTHAPVPMVPVGLDLGGTTSAPAASATGGLQSNRQSPSPLKRAQSRHFDIDTNNPANSASKRSSFSSTTSASSVWPGTSATATDASRTTTPYYNLTQGMAGLGLGGPIGVAMGSGVPSPHPGMGSSPSVVPGMAPIAPTPVAPTAVHPGLADDDLIPTAIVIKNIPFAIKKEQLLDVMTQLRLPLPYAFNYHFDNGVFRGLAFANFTTADETAAVIGSLNGREIGGRKLRVEYKKMLPLAERERIERDKRERRGQLEEQHRGQGGQGGGRRNVSGGHTQQHGGAQPPQQQQQQQQQQQATQQPQPQKPHFQRSNSRSRIQTLRPQAQQPFEYPPHTHSPLPDSEYQSRNGTPLHPGTPGPGAIPAPPYILSNRDSRRLTYKPKSSIPKDISSSRYASQCLSAAISSRLNPLALCPDEFDLLRNHLSPLHVTTYLNIRNGILRLWLCNPLVGVSLIEAAGVAREERYFYLAEVAYEFLVRQGYINFGCIEVAKEEPPTSPGQEFRDRKPRLTVVVIGAGIAGLGCARQLENLFNLYADRFEEYEDVPRVVVLEGRKRIGGRIYTQPLKSDPNYRADLGGSVIMGFGRGNPLAILARRQLGLPLVGIDTSTNIIDETSGGPVSDDGDTRVEKLLEYLLAKLSVFKSQSTPPKTIEGDEALMTAGKDPHKEDFHDTYEIIAKMEESYSPNEQPNEQQEPTFLPDDITYLESLGFKRKPVTIRSKDKTIPVTSEPPGEVHPSLGRTIDKLLVRIQRFITLTEEDTRLLHWHLANLEFANGTSLDQLSLSSWNQDEGHEFTGRHSRIPNGFMSTVRGLYTYPDKLDVRFNSTAKVVEYEDEEQTSIFLENGERIHADKICVTVPLGVLKARAIQFIPDLPQWKTDSIERLAFGVVNKICLVFDECFWDDSKDVLCVVKDAANGSADDAGFKQARGFCNMFWNNSAVVGKPCLIGTVSGEAAKIMADKSDEEIVDAALKSLQVITGKDATPSPVESIVTRWQIDPFSRGAYSCIGLEATGADFDLLARPVHHDIFFAGEATCRTHPSTVHGAYLSSLRAASEILDSLIGEIEMPHPLVPHKMAGFRRSFMQHHQTPGQQQQPQQMAMGGPHRMSIYGQPAYGSQPMLVEEESMAPHAPAVHLPQPVMAKKKRPAEPSPPVDVKKKAVEQDTNQTRLKELRDERVSKSNEIMRDEMVAEIGERPIKPERAGANPFLIFQKDFWDKCRAICDKKKQESSGEPTMRAARNEVRSALGKMWRDLPDSEKQPYIDQTNEIKALNAKKTEEYRIQAKRYEEEAEQFKRRWKEEHVSEPSQEEVALMKLIKERK